MPVCDLNRIEGVADEAGDYDDGGCGLGRCPSGVVKEKLQEESVSAASVLTILTSGRKNKVNKRQALLTTRTNHSSSRTLSIMCREEGRPLLGRGWTWPGCVVRSPQ